MALIKQPITLDHRFQTQLEMALKFEAVAIGALQCLHHEARLDTNVNSYYKNLLFYVHQNVLCIAALILQKLPQLQRSSNSWALRIKDLIEKKSIHYQGN